MFSLKLMHEIAAYLETRPFREVVALLGAIQAEHAALQKSEEKPTPDADSQGA